MKEILFSQSYADTVQYISFIFGLIGVFLLVADYKYPQLNQKMETSVDRLGDKMKDYTIILKGTKSFNALVTLTIVFLFFIIIPWVAGMFNTLIVGQLAHNIFYELYITGIVLIMLFGLFITIPLLGDLVDFLNDFSNGHALGTLGVMLDLIGVLGEFYQILTGWIN